MVAILQKTMGILDKPYVSDHYHGNPHGSIGEIEMVCFSAKVKCVTAIAKVKNACLRRKVKIKSEPIRQGQSQKQPPAERT